jgi:hypothetical protein
LCEETVTPQDHATKECLHIQDFFLVMYHIFANMTDGDGLTRLPNQNPGSQLRLCPPGVAKLCTAL